MARAQRALDEARRSKAREGRRRKGTTMSPWDALSRPWQAAFAEAIAAYLRHGSAPIGAVVVDARGEIVARGGNGASTNRLSHAEVNALAAIPTRIDRSKCEIYTTLEPCPMCTGAIRMSQLRGVHFAAFDPSAGFTAYLQANEFMREFPCSSHPPTNIALELVIVSLVTEYRKRAGHDRWRERWTHYHPQGAACGGSLAASRAHAEWVASSLTPEQLYDHLVSVGAP